MTEMSKIKLLYGCYVTDFDVILQGFKFEFIFMHF